MEVLSGPDVEIAVAVDIVDHGEAATAGSDHRCVGLEPARSGPAIPLDLGVLLFLGHGDDVDGAVTVDVHRDAAVVEAGIAVGHDVVLLPAVVGLLQPDQRPARTDPRRELADEEADGHDQIDVPVEVEILGGELVGKVETVVGVEDHLGRHVVASSPTGPSPSRQ